ncbi:hypothetical protein AN958_00626 [Leucoagaricus sp. SymC.cos]|nr:hypothetical protein AN958_00626 [Leucoagaricus sp. SymC.cos]
MDTAATKLLESATIKTLHAHNFSRSSTQSTLVLTDLLARYLALLSETSAKHAHHAGRTSLTAYDALAALEEMGVEIDELEEYFSIEVKELNRYAQHSVRRAEDLNELKAQLATGLRQDRDDAILLEFGPYESPPASEYGGNEAEDEDVDMDAGTVPEDDSAMMVDTQRVQSPSPMERKTPPPRHSTPPLPLSPISNPSSPSRKRARTANWKPPPHIPSFLPPFPSVTTDPPPSIPSSPHDPQLPETQLTELMPPPPDPKIDKPIVPVSQTMTASAASDYLVQVPYSQSSLSSVSEWHLPTPPPLSSRSQSRKKAVLPTLQSEPALFKAYHHILTHRGPSTPPPSTLSRHKIAMAFLTQTQNTPRWDAPDTLFSTVAPCSPRVAVIGPSYPVATSDPINGKVDPNNKDKDFRFPQTIPRPVSTTERLTPLLGQQSNRIPELARHVLPPVVMTRITRLTHPPVLHRGTKPLLYGPGIPAPWNSHVIPPSDGTSGVPPTPTTKEKDKDKDKDRENGEAPTKPIIPDAQLFATWDFESKDFKVPLQPSATGGTGVGGHRPYRSRVGSIQQHPSGSGSGAGSSGVISLPLSATSRTKSGSKHG